VNYVTHAATSVVFQLEIFAREKERRCERSEAILYLFSFWIASSLTLLAMMTVGVVSN
jgi:hypothetical protein